MSSKMSDQDTKLMQQFMQLTGECLSLMPPALGGLAKMAINEVSGMVQDRLSKLHEMETAAAEVAARKPEVAE